MGESVESGENTMTHVIPQAFVSRVKKERGDSFCQAYNISLQLFGNGM